MAAMTISLEVRLRRLALCLGARMTQPDTDGELRRFLQSALTQIDRALADIRAEPRRKPSKPAPTTVRTDAKIIPFPVGRGAA